MPEPAHRPGGRRAQCSPPPPGHPSLQVLSAAPRHSEPFGHGASPAHHPPGQSRRELGASHPYGHPHRGGALRGASPSGDGGSASGWRRSSGAEGARAWGAPRGPAGGGMAAPREPRQGAGDPPGKPAVGRDAPRRPSSVNRTSRGFLLSWWSPPEANCSGGGSSELPPRAWTVTSRPWLLLSSSVQSRTWRAKPVSPQHRGPEEAPHRCPHGRCQPGGSVNQPPMSTLVSQPWQGAVLLQGCGTGGSGQAPAPVPPAGQRDGTALGGMEQRPGALGRALTPLPEAVSPPHGAAGTTGGKWHRSPNSCCE